MKSRNLPTWGHKRNPTKTVTKILVVAAFVIGPGAALADPYRLPYFSPYRSPSYTSPALPDYTYARVKSRCFLVARQEVQRDVPCPVINRTERKA